MGKGKKELGLVYEHFTNCAKMSQSHTLRKTLPCLEKHPSLLWIRKKVAKFKFEYIQIHIQVKWK